MNKTIELNEQEIAEIIAALKNRFYINDALIEKLESK